MAVDVYLNRVKKSDIWTTHRDQLFYREHDVIIRKWMLEHTKLQPFNYFMSIVLTEQNLKDMKRDLSQLTDLVNCIDNALITTDFDTEEIQYYDFW